MAVKILIGKQFPLCVIPLIESAKQDIKIIVFDWRWYPNDSGNPVQVFNQSLVRAVSRGVKVCAVCNVEGIFKFLRNVGIGCKRPATPNLIHAKIMLIDNKILIIGSHNYTQSAFTMNHEVSAVIDGSDCFSSLIDYFNDLFYTYGNR